MGRAVVYNENIINKDSSVGRFFSAVFVFEIKIMLFGILFLLCSIALSAQHKCICLVTRECCYGKIYVLDNTLEKCLIFIWGI